MNKVYAMLCVVSLGAGPIYGMATPPMQKQKVPMSVRSINTQEEKEPMMIMVSLNPTSSQGAAHIEPIEIKKAIAQHEDNKSLEELSSNINSITLYHCKPNNHHKMIHDNEMISPDDQSICYSKSKANEKKWSKKF
jgi:hypothetical protein